GTEDRVIGRVAENLSGTGDIQVALGVVDADMITDTKTAKTPETSDLIIRDLTRVLYGEDAAHHHERWRKLVSTPPFPQRAETGRADRLDLSYQRLRLIAEAAEDGEQLAADPVALAALHEWTALVDGGLTTVAGIHYNLFLGSLVDHDG